MNNKPVIVYYAWTGKKTPDAFMRLLKSGFFFCIFQEVDAVIQKNFGARIGGSPTADVLIIDLGDESARTASDILADMPRLKGRLLIVGGFPADNVIPEGAAIVSPKKVVQTVRALVERPRPDLRENFLA